AAGFSFVFFFSSRRRHTRFSRDWSSDVCSSDLVLDAGRLARRFARISPAAANLIELTAADPVTFIAVFSTPFGGITAPREIDGRSEERRVGKERRSRWAPAQQRKRITPAPREPR